MKTKDENYNEFEMYKKMFGGDPETLDNAANNKHRMDKNKCQEYVHYSGNRKRTFKF